MAKLTNFSVSFIIICYLATSSAGKRETLTPRSEAASFSTEAKRNTDEILNQVQQAKIHTIDELKRLHSAFGGFDQSIKTDVSAVKNEIVNNMKRHLGMVLSQLSTMYGMFSIEIPKHRNQLMANSKDMLNKLASLQNTLDKFFGYFDAFKLMSDNALDEQRAMNRDILLLLDKIYQNTDLGNTDTNSVGRQIKEIVTVTDEIAQAIGEIDRRLPGIDMNGDGLQRNIQSHFESLNLKLDGFSKVDTAVSNIARRLETLLERHSDNAYPRNDNHIPQFGNIPSGIPITPPMTTFE